MNGGASSSLPTAQQVDREDQRARWAGTTGWARLAGQPPRWFFHLVLVVPLAALLWSATTPGGLFSTVLVAVPAIGVLGIIWVVRAVLVLAITPRAPRFARWLAVAPVGGALVLALIVTDVPLKARWAQSRPDFEQVVAADDLTGPGGSARQGWVPVPGFPRRVGSYDITNATRRGEEVLFVEAHGGFIDPVGFGYLPSGPDATNRQSSLGLLLDIEPLGSGWYTFTLRN